MNIKMLNAYLKLLGPAPKGKMWKMVKVGETLREGMKAVDIKQELGGSGEWISGIHDNDIGLIWDGCEGDYAHMRYWGLVPRPLQKWRKSPMDIFNEKCGHLDLDVESVDAIISDFIKDISTEKDFRVWLNTKTKLIESYSE